jgi:hypothetical protein
MLVTSDNSPAPNKENLDEEATPATYRWGKFGDWETCVWLLMYSERDRMVAKIFLSAPGDR